MARFLNYFELKQRILEERDKIPLEVPAASYELRSTKPYHHGNAMRGGIRKALRCLEQCQSATDVVEVVRCKDCKHYMTIHCTCDGCCISDDWYCADGERKNGDGNGTLD